MILIVDDEPAVARAHARQLRHIGHQTHCVHEGASAIAYATSHRPCLIVLDLNMPEMHGLEVLEALKSDPATASIPVVVCSATSDPTAPERSLAGGAAAFVDKLHADWDRLVERLLPRPDPTGS